MQELEKILEEIKAHRNFASECGNFNVASAFELCVEIIRKHMNDDWIPCSERLPTEEECEKDNNEFLVQTDTGKRFSCEYDPLANGYDNPLWCCNVPVVAWQPLPELYRPERSEEK